MKSVLNKLGFHKIDEMEKSIALKSQRITLVYLLVALILWSFYESYQVHTYHTSINLLPCFLLMSASWVLIISQAIFKKQAVKDDEEYKKENSIWKFNLVTAVIVGTILAIGSFAIMSGIFS